MKKNNRLEKRRKKIPKEIDLFVSHSFDIVDRIHEILTKKGLEQKDLAQALGKKESEISKWMTGTHNFTIKTISKIEAVLGEPIINASKEKIQEVPTRVYITDLDYVFRKSRHSIIVSSHLGQIKNVEQYSNSLSDVN